MSASDARRAIETWVGALSSGGVLAGSHASPEARAGRALATFVVGEAALEELRAFVAAVGDDKAIDERCAAIEVCIWMAHADRHLHAEERGMLENLVAASRLSEAQQARLLASIETPPPLEKIEQRLTHPVLRELIMALAWELALSDGVVDAEEEALFLRLATQLEVPLRRAQELREAMEQRVG
ncbi:MAG: TerB family tellurite resistance protein [Sandaracinaceae bacterium]